jgi:hypothetical protein
MKLVYPRLTIRKFYGLEAIQFYTEYETITDGIVKFL